MKLARSLPCLLVLAALSLTSCTDANRNRVMGRTYSMRYDPFGGWGAFGGWGGGYGNGYSIWPQPTLGYDGNYSYDDHSIRVGESWEH